MIEIKKLRILHKINNNNFNKYMKKILYNDFWELFIDSSFS